LKCGSDYTNAFKCTSCIQAVQITANTEIIDENTITRWNELKFTGRILREFRRFDAAAVIRVGGIEKVEAYVWEVANRFNGIGTTNHII